MDLEVFKNIDLLFVGIAVAFIGTMGFSTYFTDKNNLTNKTFLALCFTGMIWSILNYLSYTFHEPYLVLWILRIAVFFAVWFSFFIFELFYYFPYESSKYRKIYRYYCVPISVIASSLTLTPWVFKSVSEFTVEGRVSKVANGPGIAIFGLAVFSLVGLGIYYLYMKMRVARGEEKQSTKLILQGVSITSILLIIFNFVFPAILENPRYINFGGVFFIPFIGLTTYAIVKHHLFNVKVITTEALTLVLSIVTFIEVTLSDNIPTLILRSSLFVLVLTFGILLIRSVRKEIEQKEMLQRLSVDLGHANEQLKVMDKARAEFISVASHQLRTPPATIKWYLAAVLGGDYGKLTPNLKKAIERAQLTNNGQISLIDDMLNASRIERGKMEFIFESTDLEKIVQTHYANLLPQAEMRKLKLTYTGPKSKLPPITADKEKLGQVVNNLIDNALKYTKTGEVNVSLTATDKDFIIQVKDSGKGLEKGEESSIFQKYGRGKDSKKQSSGLGLGLYVAKVVVEHHNGKITAKSDGPGKGTTFTVTLPIKTDLKAEVFDFTKNQTP
ncbi:MAG TPA: ATP-binding protein [Candidatus Binatia bacterium]|nr:ATP-binding protein [Candidatus Binatia bacterium]